MDRPPAPAFAAGGPQPSGDAEQKRALRAFLMSRRARLKPADVGLPETTRRRTPGLRREEVAALAGLSTAWYTLFEMAKETRVSRKALDAIAAALRLSAAESRHLHVLAGAVTPLPLEAQPASDPVLQSVLDGFAAGPALVLDSRMDVRQMNAIAVKLFGDLTAETGYARNWLWLVASGRAAIVNDEALARELAAIFRPAYCEHAGEPDYGDLLDELLRTSSIFRDAWPRHDIAPGDDLGPLVVRHAAYGELHFAVRALALANAARARCWFLVPDDATRATPAYGKLLARAD